MSKKAFPGQDYPDPIVAGLFPTVAHQKPERRSKNLKLWMEAMYGVMVVVVACHFPYFHSSQTEFEQSTLHFQNCWTPVSKMG
ncbi:hypothetical protein MPNT_460004 [Candidatus Methylacidithermus pantelleriae]|uniref:Uncharacterized protein n=1 Tax=Candidatus Methylacidithermus pantelleriae TaxID=2744239 RepID=A0A8J2BK78_9BACT|nr:hypothetical protein MPNT_460004 [Candidatus Methylacidithermus pantelleriae]